MRILIVDDNKESLYLLEALLKGNGYEVISAKNGAEALEKLRTESVDMIISDVLMPVMDGFKFCKEVKGKDELKNIPFIFYTATYKDEKDEKLALRLGADKYILKPAEPQELIKIIQGVIRDVEEGKFEPKKAALEEEQEVFKLYSERLVNKLEKKMLELEREITVRKQAEKRIEHLNLVLRAIRSVNQLIIREKDRNRLIQDACRNFIKNRGFYSAWIALVDESHRLVIAAEAGLGKAFQPLLKNLKQGNLPKCMRRVLAKPGILTIKDPASACGDCPLSNAFKENEILSSRLEHDGNIYGILTISFPTDYVSEKEERSLFEEIVCDIAYALHHIELEDEHKKAGEALRQRTHDLGERVKELSCLYEIDEAIRKEGLTVEEVLEKIVRTIPPSWRYPEITGSCITFENRKYKTKNFKETKWMQREDIIVNAKKAGLVKVCYLEEKPEDYEGPFLKEERDLMKGVVKRLAQFIERKRAEEQIRASLKEKEVLLQEVHHRVKNNMQLISSLFSLQSRHIKDKQAYEIFKSSQNRVRSMAIIHERLYQSKDFARIDFAEYVQSLTGHLLSSYGINQDVIKLYIDIKDVFLDINTAVPCSLIINELISNSLKHAFPRGKKGEIKIAAHPLNKNEIELVVSDNGVGIPEKVDFRETESMGLHLIAILAEDQLHGDIKLDRTKGTSFHIIFRPKR